MIRKLNIKLMLMALALIFAGSFVHKPVVAYANGSRSTEASGGSSEDGSLKEYSNKLDIRVDENGGGITGESVPSGSETKNQTVKTGNKIINIITTIYTLVAAAGGIILGIVFIIHAVSLAKNGTNPQGKSQAVNGLILTGVAAALVGGSAIFVALFFNVFR